MKKLLVAILALTTVSAFAGNSMVRLDGCFDGQCDSLDFSQTSDSIESTAADDDEKSQNLAINYAMSFAGNWGAGITYKQRSETVDGDVTSVDDNYTTTGLSFYWNKDGSWDDSCFAALHYSMTQHKETDATGDDDHKDTDITLEYGHRYKLGSLMGVNWNWSPSVSYMMSTDSYEDDDDKATALMLNVANVAVTW